MHGEPALRPDFAHLPYADPAAPRGGRLTLGLQGTFDSLNPYVVRGVAPDALPRYVLQSLMARSQDEPFTLYGLVARTVEMPEDRSFAVFNLDPRARFSDGRPLTAEDVRFSLGLLKAHGKPFHRSALNQVTEIRVEGPHRIRLAFGSGEDRELPLIVAMMPIFPAHATDPERFPETTFAPPVGSGPYRVAQVRPGERIVLERRSDYWGEDLPVQRGLFNFEEIRYDFYRDANALFEAFKAGLYDYRVEGDPVRWSTGYDFPAVREGRVRVEASAIRAPKGMHGFVFNTRRDRFADARVREALGLVFDFAWVNRNLYHGRLRRSRGYFDDSDLSSAGRPADARERALLARFPEAVREDVLEGSFEPPGSDGSGRDREAAAAPSRSWSGRASRSGTGACGTRARASPSASRSWRSPGSRSGWRSTTRRRWRGSGSRPGSGWSTTCSSGAASPPSTSTWCPGPGPSPPPRARSSATAGARPPRTARAPSTSRAPGSPRWTA
jgi:peptide/nickel transport system substrate-binding protein